MIAILLVVVAVSFVRKAVGVLGILPKIIIPILTTLIPTIAPLCVAVVYHPIRSRVAMYAYVSWLKSFEEPQKHSENSWRLVDIPCRFRPKLRSITQVSIELLSRGRGNSAIKL